MQFLINTAFIQSYKLGHCHSQSAGILFGTIFSGFYMHATVARYMKRQSSHNYVIMLRIDDNRQWSIWVPSHSTGNQEPGNAAAQSSPRSTCANERFCMAILSSHNLRNGEGSEDDNSDRSPTGAGQGGVREVPFLCQSTYNTIAPIQSCHW